MTPFWIVDFIEKDSCESFFETYWQSYIQNNPTVREDPEPERYKFFHITDATAVDMTKEQLREIGEKRLARDDSSGRRKLIKSIDKNEGNKLNVIFLGDLSQQTTLDRFHLWATYLRRKLLDTPWYSFSSVFFYGVLYRPDSMSVNPLPDETRAFLNELATLENLDNINIRPFNNLMFIQSNDMADHRASVEQSLHIAAYHIARTDGNDIRHKGDKKLFDANATGVFYEANVCKEQNAHGLGQIMLNDFIASEDSYFYDVDEAKKFVDSKSDYIARLDANSIATTLFDNHPNPDIANIKRPCHPMSLNIRKVWRHYYGNYIPNLKSDLVNEMKRTLLEFEKEYLQRMYLNQEAFISERAETLQDIVFEMFCNLGDRSLFKHIGLHQCRKVLDLFRNRIENVAKNSSRTSRAFLLPTNLEKAAQMVDEDKPSENSILDKLATRLQKLPVYNPARLLRILMLGGLVGTLIFLFTSPLAFIAIPLIILIDLLIFHSNVNHIETLKDQYVAYKLGEIRHNLENKVDTEIKKTYEQMAKYIDWLGRKIDYLQDNMSTVAPPQFHFAVSKVFQPLVSSTPDSEDNPRILIPSHIVKFEDLRKIIVSSGSFNNNPLTENTPDGHITLPITHSDCPIISLIDGQKDNVQQLVQSLMDEKVKLNSGIEMQVCFSTHPMPDSRTMLLLLDNSGSMYGDSIEQMKEYVKSLSMKGNVEWIAFDNTVSATSRANSLDSITAQNGTCYIPAIEKAVEWLKESDYDDIILISDGAPFESTKEIIEAAKALGQPLNTISISNGAESVLVELACATGGTEISVDSIDDIRIPEDEELILPRIVGLRSGEYTFGELMKHGQVIACAEILHNFALKQLASTSPTTLTLLERYGNPMGLCEWFDFTSPGTMSRGVSPKQTNHHLAIACNKINNLTTKLEKVAPDRHIFITEVNTDPDDTKLRPATIEPDMIVSMLVERSIDIIGDLQWAMFSENDTTLTHRDELETLIDGEGVINIYNNPVA